MYFWRGTKTLLPMACPVVVLHGYFLGCFCVPADCHTVDQTPHQCQEAKYQKYDAQHPVEKKQVTHLNLMKSTKTFNYLT